MLALMDTAKEGIKEWGKSNPAQIRSAASVYYRVVIVYRREHTKTKVKYLTRVKRKNKEFCGM